MNPAQRYYIRSYRQNATSFTFDVLGTVGYWSTHKTDTTPDLYPHPGYSTKQHTFWAESD